MIYQQHHIYLTGFNLHLQTYHMRLRIISEYLDLYDLINNDPDPESGREIHPDSFYRQPGAVPFIYNPDGTLFYTDNQHINHYQLVVMNLDYYDLPHPDDDQFAVSDFVEFDLRSRSLVGRAGWLLADVRAVAFWNDDLRPELVQPCLQQLIRYGIITPDSYMITADDETLLVSDILATEKHRQAQLTPEQERKREMMRQLHLMKPQEKKATMKELGLVGGGHKQPWQKSAEKAGIVQPGQKWWAMSSEDFTAQQLLENVPVTGAVRDKRGDWVLMQYPMFWVIRNNTTRITHTGKREYMMKLWNAQYRPWSVRN